MFLNDDFLSRDLLDKAIKHNHWAASLWCWCSPQWQLDSVGVFQLPEKTKQVWQTIRPHTAEESSRACSTLREDIRQMMRQSNLCFVKRNVSYPTWARSWPRLLQAAFLSVSATICQPVESLLPRTPWQHQSVRFAIPASLISASCPYFWFYAISSLT